MDSKLFTLHTIETFWNKIKDKFYVKSANGIPKSDLDTTVQSSLDKADSALQEHQDISEKQDKSTAVTHIKNTAVGSTTKPVYIAENGTATPISHSINSDVPSNAKFTDTVYTHPTHTAHTKGFYKFANDGLGHVSDAEKVTKDDIVDLGIPGSIPIYNVDVDEEYGHSEGMIIATIVVNQTAHPIGVPIIGENENADYGLMSASDKKKLDGISDNANNYVHPTTSGNKHIPSGGSSGQILRWSADGTAVWGADNNTTYSDATQSTHGLMTAADKKKLDGMDLSKYLPLSGGVMTGAIDTATNGVDITVNPNRPNKSSPTLVAGGSYEVSDVPTNTLKKYKSLIGTYHNTKTDAWFDMISVRHRNGYGDGANYGMYLFSKLTSTGNLIWNKQTAANTWQGDRTLLDSANFTDYALPKDGTAKKAEAMSNGVLRSGFYVNTAANATTGHVWFRMATCKISDAYETVNTTFLITNGMVGHALLSCGIRNDGTGKAAESCSLNFSARNGSIAIPSEMFRVVAINSSTGVTYELWGQISARQSGIRYTVLDERNIAGGKCNIWKLENHSDADAKTAPTTGNYYVNSSDISVCATATKAETLTDSGWITCPLAVTGNTTYPTSASTIRVRKYGKMVKLEGLVKYAKAFNNGHNVAIIPDGYRPEVPMELIGVPSAGSGTAVLFYVGISPAGSIGFSPANSAGSATFNPAMSYNFQATYFID